MRNAKMILIFINKVQINKKVLVNRSIFFSHNLKDFAELPTFVI